MLADRSPALQDARLCVFGALCLVLALVAERWTNDRPYPVRWLPDLVAGLAWLISAAAL
jgi:hypothetical protein